MKQLYKGGGIFKKLLIFAILGLAFALVSVCLFFQNKDNSVQIPTASAANAATFSVSGEKKYDSYGSTEQVTAPNPLTFAHMTGSSDFSSSFVGNTLSVNTAYNKHGEAYYSDITATINVPAWYKYEVEYKFVMHFQKISSYVDSFCELYNFDSDTIIGSTAGGSGLRFGNVVNGTTPSNYIVSSIEDPSDLELDVVGYLQSTTYTKTYTYTNNTGTAIEKSQNFGAFAYSLSSTSYNSRIIFSVQMSATVKETKLSATKPQADTTVYKYTGNPQVYTPTEVLADKPKYRLASTSDSLTQTNVDNYSIVYELIDPTNAPWDDGSTDNVELQFIINKGDLNIGINYDGKGNSRYLSKGLPQPSDITITGPNSGVSGTFSWDPEGQTASTSVTNYTWKFMPDDQDSWNVKKDTENITFIDAPIKGVKIIIKDDPNIGDIYDRYDADSFDSFEAYIKHHISVYYEHVDNTLSASPIPDSGYTVVTKQSEIMVGIDSVKQQKKIKVRVAGAGGNYSAEETTDIYESVITGADIYQKIPLVHQFVYPMTTDEIEENYIMGLEWNFAPSKYIEVDSKYVTVSVLPSSGNPSGVVQAGDLDLTFTFSDNGRTYSEDLLGDCTLEKGTYDISGVSISDKSVQFDGNKQTISVTGNVKDKKTGNAVTSVTFAYSYQKDNSELSTDGVESVGVYKVVASFINNDTTNYNNITDTLSATLTVTNLGWDMSGVTYKDDTTTFDTNYHKLEIDGTLPDNRITVTYKYEKDGVEVTAPNGVKDAGVYTVTAMFSNPDPSSYGDIADMTATLTINKATLDMSDVSFEDKTVTSNGTTAFTIEIIGNLPHPSIVVTYTVAGTGETSFVNAGVYNFTASFSNPDPANYNNIADMTATLTVEENPDGPPPVENPPEDKEPGFIEKLLASHFPLWQVAVMAVSAILAIIFLAKAIQYGNRAKKAKGEAKKISARAYATLLPIFSTEIVALGLSNKIWSIMAFALAGLALLMFVVALITRSSWKKAELAKESALDEREQRKYEAQNASQLALQERITQIGRVGDAGNLDEILRQRDEEHRREMAEREERYRRDEEDRRREDEARHREEMAALREEQAKRDEAMKVMLAGMMGSRHSGDDDMIYGSLDDTDMLVQRVIAGLLPAVQQMIPEPTAYLAAPGEANTQNLDELAQMVADRINIPTAVAYEQSESNLDAIADRVAERLNSQPIYDNSDELIAQMNAMQQQIAKLGKSAPVADNSDIVEQMNALQQQIANLGAQPVVANNNGELIAKMNQMQQQISILSQNQYDMSVLDEDDEDIFDDEEEWDSILDEDEDDNFVESVIIEADGTVRKVYPNFRMRLKESSEKNREWYTAIKNLFCSQKGITYRVYKRVEKIRYQGNVIAVIGIAKRSIKLWLALKPYEYDARRYHHKDVSDKPRFVDVPLYVRVGSDRALTRAQELILALFQEQNTEARKRYTDRSIQELIFTLKYNKLLTKKGYKQLLCESIHVHDCDILDDETAEKCIETKNVDFIDDSVIETVKLDDIDAKFLDGNRITLEKLKKVGLVSEECTGYTVTVDKRLTKPLIVVANDFTLPAIKMIALTGGRVIRLTNV